MPLGMPVEIPFARCAIGTQFTTKSPFASMQEPDVCIHRASSLIFVAAFAARVTKIKVYHLDMLDKVVPIVGLV